MSRAGPRWRVHAVAIALLLVALAPASQSHDGSGTTLAAVDRIEAESYDTYDQARDSCEGRDGEHTRPVNDASASGRQHLFLPYGDECGVSYQGVLFPTVGRFDAIRVRPTTDEGLCREVSILVDGRPVGHARFCGSSGQTGWATVDVDDAQLVTRGQHDVRIEHEVLPGRSEWRNLRVDWISFTSSLLS